jgi:hypothetical protein
MIYSDLNGLKQENMDNIRKILKIKKTRKIEIQLEQNRLEVQKFLLHMKFSQCNCLQKSISAST